MKRQLNIENWNLSHARSSNRPDIVPEISFGKMTEREGKQSMPISIYVHHVLLDGYHVGRFIERFQRLLDE